VHVGQETAERVLAGLLLAEPQQPELEREEDRAQRDGPGEERRVLDGPHQRRGDEGVDGDDERAGHEVEGDRERDRVLVGEQLLDEAVAGGGLGGGREALRVVHVQELRPGDCRRPVIALTPHLTHDRTRRGGATRRNPAVPDSGVSPLEPPDGKGPTGVRQLLRPAETRDVGPMWDRHGIFFGR
ncbi:hypothetical protein ADL26_03215, partial [Thermoactinomyces vulgaris]